MMTLGHMDWFEILPLPVVSYSYGGFITFREDLESEHYFCSCMKDALENYLIFHKLFNKCFPESNKKWTELNDWYFPEKFVKYIDTNQEKYNEFQDAIMYKENLCHRCNQLTPHRTFRNNYKMPEFKKWYGWYIVIGYLESGILPETFMYNVSLLSEDVEPYLDFTYEDLWEDLQRYEEIEYLNQKELKNWLVQLDLTYEIGQPRVVDKQYPENFIRVVNKVVNRRYTRVNRVVENKIRKKFNYKVMSGNWKNEECLYMTIKSLYPDYTILKHYRPKVLDGLELDVYIKELKWGIEYQGIQHYEALEHLGGERGLEKTMKRDELKKELCNKNGIRLIYFYYDEELSIDLVKKRLDENGELSKKDNLDGPTPVEDPHIMGLLKMAKDVNQD